MTFMTPTPNEKGPDKITLKEDFGGAIAHTGPVRPPTPLDLERIRRDFPILARQIHGRPLVYLDNAATTQKPQAVIDAVSEYYAAYNSNVHRGVHTLSEEATNAYDEARHTVARFLHADNENEIVFVRGATEAINLVAQSYARPRLKAGDEILITHLEHHSNIVPWQLVAEQTGATLRVAPINDRGEVPIDDFAKLLNERTRIVSVAHVSNALGTVNPVKKFVDLAHRAGAVVLVDGAQAVSHMKVNVVELGCDFYAFSGHKVFGPTGIGALYGKMALLESMPPYQGGGDMIKSVTFAKTTYATTRAFRFEAGTPNISALGPIGLAAALDYVQNVGLEAISDHDTKLLTAAAKALEEVPGVKLVGTAPNRAGVLSFTLGDIHPHDAGTILDRQGVAVRTGHHCAQPVMERFNIPATIRASLALYNTREEIDALVKGLQKVREIFGS